LPLVERRAGFQDDERHGAHALGARHVDEMAADAGNQHRNRTRRRDAGADCTLLASRASVPQLMVYDRRSTLSRALAAGAQALFCPAMTLGS
jgi:hypothetical protein